MPPRTRRCPRPSRPRRRSRRWPGAREDHAEGVAAFAEKRDPRFARPMNEIRTVGVLGAGTMGAGHRPGRRRGRPRACSSTTRSMAPRERALRAHRRLPRAQAWTKGQLNAMDAGDALAAHPPGRQRRGALPRPTWSIEAIPEDLALKRDAFRRLDAAAAEGAILATNTSSLSVGAIAIGHAAAPSASSACTSSTRSR